ncbi:hypothetical protein ASPSYDRAFT_453114 [Aspergillus sydowii CBS 593.65]|uniref:HTH araC/xylS-type domain-containing protein n=1 Tax=Aspergillus sydowii CBS 593.65 TaxID=1036612 RepID=A0A1L9T738_9EURO|nr:uncharacterized protein ASPSYDRAFT_453114 [Aspergillus sydowii CBS 593.65]OJJ55228.1 hypothetical protein ASPSYDRAFT_453114 [Aspergillus sydowii CBS 593.65]
MSTQPQCNQPQPVAYQTTASRWHALTHRSPPSHSSFLYGVKSTKIYCRPTCSARLARRANVVFYDNAAQARDDGFRPCLRCQPDNPRFMGEAEDLVLRSLVVVHRWGDGRRRGGAGVGERKGERIGLADVAGEVGVSASYLARVFKRTMGVTLGAYVDEFERGEKGEGEDDRDEDDDDNGEVHLTQPAWDKGDKGMVVKVPVVRGEDSSLSGDNLEGKPASDAALESGFELDERLITEEILDGKV